MAKSKKTSKQAEQKNPTPPPAPAALVFKTVCYGTTAVINKETQEKRDVQVDLRVSEDGTAFQMNCREAGPGFFNSKRDTVQFLAAVLHEFLAPDTICL